ncbi:MAG TPA: signal peptidase II [Lachnospiraceae bacterium]|nr:signal peptidase II [Lachnospiraceae bacterium]
MSKENRGHGWWGIPVLALLVCLDQWTKAAAITHLRGSAGIDLISGVLRLEYLENRGAAFGIFQNQQWISLILAAVFLVAAIFFWVRMPASRRMLPMRLITVALAAGAIGNMVDRVIRHYVVDFIYFCLIDFPVFNVADIYVTCSCVLALILVFFYYRDEEFDFLFDKKKENTP